MASSLTHFSSSAARVGRHTSQRTTKLDAHPVGLRTNVARLVVRAEASEAAKPSKAKAKDEPPAPWTPPKLDPSTPSPIFGGSTGGLLRKAQVKPIHLLPVDPTLR